LVRPRKKDKVYPRTLSFSYKETDMFELTDGEINAQTVIDGIDDICDRERTSRSGIIMKALAEYWDRHIKGNYQTVMESFEPGGHRSDGQLEQEIINTMLGIPEWQDIKWSIIRLRLKEIGYPMKKLTSGADRIARVLQEKGRKVWR